MVVVVVTVAATVTVVITVVVEVTHILSSTRTQCPPSDRSVVSQ
jgi:hypothetical protein